MEMRGPGPYRIGALRNAAIAPSTFCTSTMILRFRQPSLSKAGRRGGALRRLYLVFARIRRWVYTGMLDQLFPALQKQHMTDEDAA